MGMSPFKRSSFGNYRPPNPHPERFEILKTEYIGEYTIALIHYKGCTTFEGRKISVYNCTPEYLKNRSSLDPHFSDIGFVPIARFPASGQGWTHAIKFVESLS